MAGNGVVYVISEIKRKLFETKTSDQKKGESYSSDEKRRGLIFGNDDDRGRDVARCEIKMSD